MYGWCAMYVTPIERTKRILEVRPKFLAGCGFQVGQGHRLLVDEHILCRRGGVRK
jgi:hypothetical protein